MEIKTQFKNLEEEIEWLKEWYAYFLENEKKYKGQNVHRNISMEWHQLLQRCQKLGIS